MGQVPLRDRWLPQGRRAPCPPALRCHPWVRMDRRDPKVLWLHEDRMALWVRWLRLRFRRHQSQQAPKDPKDQAGQTAPEGRTVLLHQWHRRLPRPSHQAW